MCKHEGQEKEVLREKSGSLPPAVALWYARVFAKGKESPAPGCQVFWFR